MAAFRPLGQFPQYFLNDGTVNAGGFLHFYETDLTTPKTTYSDPALTIPNPNPVELTAEGYPEQDVWGDGAYGVTLSDSLSVVYRTYNNVQSDAIPGQTIPALVSGEFLSNDGAVLDWEPVLQVPDPSGFTDYILSNDGVLPVWIPQQELTEPDIEVSAANKTFRAGLTGETNKYFVLSDTGSAPASGSRFTQVAVVFPTAFTTLWHVAVTITSDGVTSAGYIPTQSVTAQSATGFTVKFNIFDDDTNPPWNITSPVNFSYIAFGIKADA